VCNEEGEEIEVRIDTLAPDIMMSDMLQIKIQVEDIQMGEMIGKGGSQNFLGKF
jgi:predicted RNA-binding protein YlqC (UPF0109 family)